jgi:hypothetical protein
MKYDFFMVALFLLCLGIPLGIVIGRQTIPQAVKQYNLAPGVHFIEGACKPDIAMLHGAITSILWVMKSSDGKVYVTNGDDSGQCEDLYKLFGPANLSCPSCSVLPLDND